MLYTVVSGLSRETIGKLLLVVASFAISVTSVEYLYRQRLRNAYARDLAAPGPSDWKLLPGDPRVYGLHPNHRGNGRFDTDKTRRFAYRTNSDGLRGPDVATKKESTVRILILGDSYTFGWALREDDAYPHQLGQLLSNGGCRAEVINAGIPGYNTEQEFHLLKGLLPKYQPDLVIVAYVMNDAEPQHNVPSSPDVVFRYSRLWTWERFKKLVNEAIPASEGLFRSNIYVHTNRSFLDGYRPDSPKWRNAAVALQGIADLSRSASTELVVVILPVFGPHFDQYVWGTIHEKVSGWARAMSVNAIDLLPHFRHEDGRQYIVEGDGHPNAVAHGKIARIVARALMNGPLSRWCR